VKNHLSREPQHREVDGTVLGWGHIALVHNSFGGRIPQLRFDLAEADPNAIDEARQLAGGSPVRWSLLASLGYGVDPRG
jgi:hypothetical protein